MLLQDAYQLRLAPFLLRDGVAGDVVIFFARLVPFQSRTRLFFFFMLEFVHGRPRYVACPTTSTRTCHPFQSTCSSTKRSHASHFESHAIREVQIDPWTRNRRGYRRQKDALRRRPSEFRPHALVPRKGMVCISLVFVSSVRFGRWRQGETHMQRVAAPSKCQIGQLHRRKEE